MGFPFQTTTSDSGVTTGVSHRPLLTFLHCAVLQSPEQLELQNHESHENYNLTWKLLIMQQAQWPPAEKKKVEGQIFGTGGKDLTKRRLSELPRVKIKEGGLMSSLPLGPVWFYVCLPEIPRPSSSHIEKTAVTSYLPSRNNRTTE